MNKDCYFFSHFFFWKIGFYSCARRISNLHLNIIKLNTLNLQCSHSLLFYKINLGEMTMLNTNKEDLNTKNVHCQTLNHKL
jgi:hypothetical protein